MSTERIYLVTGPAEKVSLVKAGNQSQALRHVARNTFKVEAASAVQVADLMVAGVGVEQASAEPQPAISGAE
jgi:hypothetical protein